MASGQTFRQSGPAVTHTKQKLHTVFTQTSLSAIINRGPKFTDGPFLDRNGGSANRKQDTLLFRTPALSRSQLIISLSHITG